MPAPAQNGDASGNRADAIRGSKRLDGLALQEANYHGDVAGRMDLMLAAVNERQKITAAAVST